jgi:nucleoside-diphosphate-sugar epimerase
MNILITGGSGLAGHAVVDLLNDLKHHKFMVVDNLSYTDDYLRNVPFQYGNVGNPDFMIPFLHKHQFDVVIHLAGVVGDAACSLRPVNAYESNINSVKILKNHFKGKIIFPSSCSVYGINKEITDESSEPNPISLYADMKLGCEELLKSTDSLILRLGTLHGITGRVRNDLVVNILTMTALLKGQINVFGGNQYRPLLHVRNLAEILLRLVASNHTGIYNLVESNYKIIDIANQIKEELPKTEIIITDMSFEDNRNYHVSGEKARDILGVTPKLKPIDSIRDIIRVYKEGRVKNLLSQKYSNAVVQNAN